MVRVTFALLVVLGVTAAVLRTVAPDDLFARMEPVRARLFRALNATEPEPARRAAFLAEGDRKFATQRTITLVHILTGAGFLALAPLQLMRRVRLRRPQLHRVTGRIAITLALTSGIIGLFFGLWQPLAGAAEQVIVGVVGLVLVSAIGLAFRHIRAGRVAAHREWMLRAIAAALAIASVRVVALPLDLVLAPRGVAPRIIFVLALWIGWVGTLAAAEWWIRSTRPRTAGAV